MLNQSATTGRLITGASLAMVLMLSACGVDKAAAPDEQSPVAVGDSMPPPPPPPPPPPSPPPPPAPPPAAQPTTPEDGVLSADNETEAPLPAAQDSGLALPDDFEIVSNVLTPAESYLPKVDNMPTGVVLLDARASDRNAQLCNALLGRQTATVRTEVAARRDDPQGDYLVTHWLARSNVSDEGNCDELLRKYDFERASRIMDTYALNDTRGPLFLALDPTGAIVFLDLEDASPAEVFQATSDWMALALEAPQTGPNAGKPPPAPRGIAANANRLFARLAGGFASLVGDADPVVVRFNDPLTGTAREFRVYRSGVYLIGATFLL